MQSLCEVSQNSRPFQLFCNLFQVIILQPGDTKINMIFSSCLVLISRWGASYPRVSWWDSLGLLLLRSMGDSSEGWHASFSPKSGDWRIVQEWYIWNGIKLGDWISPKTPKTTITSNMAKNVQDGIIDITANHVVHRQVVLLLCAAESPRGCNEFEIDDVGVVDPTLTSNVGIFIIVVWGTRIWSNAGADVIIGMGVDEVSGFAAGLIAIFGFEVGLGEAYLGEVFALVVTHLRTHMISLAIV